MKNAYWKFKDCKVEVYTSESLIGEYSVSIDFEGHHYHLWVNRETKVPKQDSIRGHVVLYRNASGEKTGHLKAFSDTWKPMVDFMLSTALQGNMYELANNAVLEKRRLQDEANDARRRKEIIESFGLELYGLLKESRPYLPEELLAKLDSTAEKIEGQIEHELC